jgi:hypothetical protein
MTRNMRANGVHSVEAHKKSPAECGAVSGGNKKADQPSQ